MPDDIVVEEWTIPAYKDVVEKDADTSAETPCPLCKGDGKIKAGHVSCPKCGGTGVMKAFAYDDQFDIDALMFAVEFGVDIPVEVEKGGPGSGDTVGHPFRGNGHTGATTAAGGHNIHGDENMSGHYHLAAAAANVAAANRSLAAGQHGAARQQFNEAARHAAWAARQHDTGQQLHQAAKSLYAASHTAGDQAEVAGKAANDAYSVDSEADPTGASMAGMRAQISDDSATAAGNTAASIVSGIRSAYGAQTATAPAASQAA